MDQLLTKSDFLRFLACPPEFWLKVKHPEMLASELSIGGEHRRQQGYEVQQLARSLSRFRPGNGVVFSFERAFQTSEYYARCDIVAVDETTGVIDLYETKSGASVKDEYIYDVAFQRFVCEEAGYTVGRSFVITVDTSYVRRGPIDAEQLLSITEITDVVQLHLPIVRQAAREAIAYLATTPVPSLVAYCDAKLDCEFIKLHFPDLPEYTIFDIPTLKNEKRRELLAKGIVAITDIPDEFPLSGKQRQQVDAARAGAISIDGEAIAERIESWQYPLRFLDYETFGHALPKFEGIRPYQQMCFQYSLHTVDSPGAKPRHSYFLSRGEGDPPRALAERLRADIGENIGTVLVWSESFEKGRNREMAEMFPDLAEFFEAVNSRTVDLMKIFSEKLYSHPDFMGRSSIKRVLPVLRPDLSYRQLRIGDGDTASISWYRAATWETMPDAERSEIVAGLETYCELDTWAMVAIFEELASSAGHTHEAHTADSTRFFEGRA